MVTAYTKKKKENLKLRLEKYPLYLVTIWASQIEQRLFELKKQGEDSNNNTLIQLRAKRNVHRLVMLNKLKQWKRNPELFSRTKEEGMYYSNLESFNEIKDLETFEEKN